MAADTVSRHAVENGRDGKNYYIKELKGITDLEGRGSGLAEIRDRVGYMVSYSKEENR